MGRHELGSRTKSFMKSMEEHRGSNQAAVEAAQNSDGAGDSWRWKRWNPAKAAVDLVTQFKNDLDKAKERAGFKEAEFPEHFSPEAKQALIDNGYTIFYVHPLPIGKIESRVRNFVFGGPLFPSALNTTPRIGQVAYKPEELFVEGGFNKKEKLQAIALNEEIGSIGRDDIQPYIDHPSTYAQIQRNESNPDSEFSLFKAATIRTRAGGYIYDVSFRGNLVKHLRGTDGTNKEKTLGVVRLVRPK